jgi:hypothetical protein
MGLSIRPAKVSEGVAGATLVADVVVAHRFEPFP